MGIELGTPKAYCVLVLKLPLIGAQNEILSGKAIFFGDIYTAYLLKQERERGRLAK